MLYLLKGIMDEMKQRRSAGGEWSVVLGPSFILTELVFPFGGSYHSLEVERGDSKARRMELGCVISAH